MPAHPTTSVVNRNNMSLIEGHHVRELAVFILYWLVQIHLFVINCKISYYNLYQSSSIIIRKLSTFHSLIQISGLLSFNEKPHIGFSHSGP